MAQLKSTSITGDLSVSGKITGTFGGLTASRALVTNSSGNVAVSAVTSTELGYLDGVTSAIQTQLNGKVASSNLRIVNGASGITTATPYQSWANSSIKNNDIVFGGDYANHSTSDANIVLCSSTGKLNMVIDGEYYASEGQQKVYHPGNKPSAADIGAAASSHTHGYLTDRTNSTASYLNYGASAVTSASYLAAWNGYELRAITPATVRTVIGAAASSHGNHVPTTQTASNKVFLRNDNTWQTVTPSNIGLKYTNILANGSSSSSISWSSGAYDFIIGISRPNASNTPCQFVIPVGFTGDVQIADDATYSVFTVSATSMTYNKGNNAKIICAWGVNVV